MSAHNLRFSVLGTHIVYTACYSMKNKMLKVCRNAIFILSSWLNFYLLFRMHWMKIPNQKYSVWIFNEFNEKALDDGIEGNKKRVVFLKYSIMLSNPTESNRISIKFIRKFNKISALPFLSFFSSCSSKSYGLKSRGSSYLLLALIEIMKVWKSFFHMNMCIKTPISHVLFSILYFC